MMSSLYIGASGMRSLSGGMAVITNNISNLNTVGFKQSMMMYQDLISSTVNSSSNFKTNISQSGAGVNMAETRTLFTVGGFETSNTATDMAINGAGFFGVQNGKETLYTRAGNFRFTKEGELVDPSGYTVLGHAIKDGVEDSTVTPVKLDLNPMTGTTFMAAKPTSSVTTISNIGGATDQTTNAANEFFAMTAKWDGTQTSPLGGGEYGYHDTVSVYDSAGNPHNLTIYYDLVGDNGGGRTYEFIVGMPPSADAGGSTKGAGLLMSGTMNFSSTGQLEGMTAFTPTGSDPSIMTAWQPAVLSNGIPTCTANFAGAGTQAITIDFGLNMNSGWNSAITSPADANAGSSVINDFYKATPGATRSPNSTTNYGTTSQNIQQKQNGYTSGELSTMNVATDGTVSGQYSNGQSQDLYRVGVYRFISQDGLRREGGNHFSATEDSGPADEGVAGTENFGGIAGNSIEQSNVDMAREFAQMIVTQRGFQMNSKVVTTSDTMLQKALELKR